MSPDGSNLAIEELASDGGWQTPANLVEAPNKESLSLMERLVLYAVLNLWLGDLSGCVMTSVRKHQIEQQLSKTFQISGVRLNLLLQGLVEKNLIEAHKSMIPDQPIYEVTKAGKIAIAPDQKPIIRFNQLLNVEASLRATLS